MRILLLALVAALGCAQQTAGKSSLVAGGAAAAPAIAIGRCAGIEDLEASKAAGFEYVELGTSAIARLTEEEFQSALARHRAVGLPTPVANLFLPGDLKVVGPDVDPPRQHDYAELAMARMAKLGVKIIVFGSGKSRHIPDGWPFDSAWTQLVDFSKRMAPIAERNGIVLAVEPLRKQETNMVNTAAEGLKWVQQVNHPHFQLMVDFYHLASEKEDPAILVAARDHIKHFHIANPNERVYPKGPRRVGLRRVLRQPEEDGLPRRDQRRGQDQRLRRGRAARHRLPARPARRPGPAGPRDEVT